jgi:tetratricopeptide (TPR) repeat protein
MKTSDAADAGLKLKARVLIGIPLWILLLAAEVGFVKPHGLLPWLAILAFNGGLNWFLAELVLRSSGAAARGFAKMVYATGDLTPTPGYSAQESLVARGFYPEAVESYEELLREHPEDVNARFNLAWIHWKHRADPQAAERIYLEIRSRTTSPAVQRRVSNALIELYRETGRRDRLLVELARFADQYRGTAEGESTRKYLQELKAGSDPTDYVKDPEPPQDR